MIRHIGLRMGNLTMVSFNRPPNSKPWTYEWKCDCGGFCFKKIADVKKAAHCGCKTRENVLASISTHGHSRGYTVSQTYTSWAGMFARCHNPKSIYFHRYGGRGISVCERWNSFEAFLEDMGERPVNTSLDRFPNKDGNYEPGNCRWATHREQMNNTSRNRILVVSGVSKSIAQWAVYLSLSAPAIRSRVRRSEPLTIRYLTLKLQDKTHEQTNDNLS